jgi:hypothetical protein
MMEDGHVGATYAMGPRVPPVRMRAKRGTMTSTLGFKVPSRALAARAEKTTPCTDPQFCEKPVGQSMTLPIILGVW